MRVLVECQKMNKGKPSSRNLNLEKLFLNKDIQRQRFSIFLGKMRGKYEKFSLAELKENVLTLIKDTLKEITTEKNQTTFFYQPSGGIPKLAPRKMIHNHFL
jgi:hypothetical protein